MSPETTNSLNSSFKINLKSNNYMKTFWAFCYKLMEDKRSYDGNYANEHKKLGCHSTCFRNNLKRKGKQRNQRWAAAETALS